jgi:hypothetical protein
MTLSPPNKQRENKKIQLIVFEAINGKDINARCGGANDFLKRDGCPRKSSH